MPTLTFVEPNGTTHVIEADVGGSVMQIATENFVDGIPAECGGCCSCATCHCYVDAETYAKIPEPDAFEIAMLSAVTEPRENSRLTCQISVSNDIDGIVLQVPEF